VKITNNNYLLVLSYFFIFISLFFFVIISLTVYASNPILVVNNAEPDIEVIYDEPVNHYTLEYILRDSSQRDITSSKLKFDEISINQKILHFSTLGLLMPGNYSFFIRVCDVIGNCPKDYFLSEFEIKFPPLNMTLVQPKFSLFNNRNTSLIFNTTRKAKCKFDDSNVDYDNMRFSFINDGSYKLVHTYNNFDKFGIMLYFKCVDEYGYEVEENHYFSFDNVKPIINVKAEDVYGLPLQTILTVNSINKDVQCKYSSDSFSNFDIMKRFTNFNLDLEQNYNQNFIHQLYSDDLNDGIVNTFYVQCISKAGVLSDIESITIDIDTNKELGIRVHFPEDYVSESRLNINISTTIPSLCNFRINNQTSYNGQFITSEQDIKHVSQSQVDFDEGENIIYLRCQDLVGERAAERVKYFVVDLTDPIMTNVTIITLSDLEDIVIDENNLNTFFSAVDDESGIRYYEYKVYENTRFGSQNITDWQQVHTRSNQVNRNITVSLNNQSNYFIQVRAVDYAGRISTEMNSNIVLYDPLTEEPIEGCTGEDGKCELGEPCNVNSDCISYYCNVTSNTCDVPSCDDDVWNGDETDVDCGGSCEPCGLDKKCEINDDCKYKNCISNKCVVQDHCKDGIQNYDETDVDCGGDCEECEEFQSCLTNNDCKTGLLCWEEVCRKYSDKDGVPDFLDNCPNIPNGPDLGTCVLEGISCNSNSECMTIMNDYCSINQEDLSGNSVGDACDPDIDADGMPNDWELRYDLNPLDPADANMDLSGDGLTNLEEYYYGTNPTKQDTDGDSWTDYEEIMIYGTDPLDPNDYPKTGGILFFIISILFILLGILGGYYIYYSKNNFIPSISTNKGNLGNNSIGLDLNKTKPNQNIKTNQTQNKYNNYGNVQSKQSGFVSPTQNMDKSKVTKYPMSGSVSQQNQKTQQSQKSQYNSSVQPKGVSSSSGLSDINNNEKYNKLKSIIKPKTKLELLEQITGKKKGLNDILEKEKKNPKEAMLALEKMLGSKESAKNVMNKLEGLDDFEEGNKKDSFSELDKLSKNKKQK
jgi:hypothetical protein